jgi:hypothetical protein
MSSRWCGGRAYRCGLAHGDVVGAAFIECPAVNVALARVVCIVPADRIAAFRGTAGAVLTGARSRLCGDDPTQPNHCNRPPQ